jgi:hypothetical protein
MASVFSGSHARTMKSYITTENFFNNLRTYQTQTSSTTYATEGRLTTPGTVAGVTTVPIVNVKTKVNLVLGDCPAGRILRETGRRLYPGQNPGLNVGDKYNGAVVGTNATQTMWVMVYDVMTGISAFINPNDTVFSVYSADKPLELINPLEGSASVLGAPVISGGVVTAVGQIRSTGQVNLTPLIVANAVTLDPTVSQLFTVTNTGNLTISASSTPVGALIRIIVIFTTGSTVTFSGFIAASSRSIPSGTASGTYALTFVSDGSNFYEVSRSGAIA